MELNEMNCREHNQKIVCKIWKNNNTAQTIHIGDDDD